MSLSQFGGSVVVPVEPTWQQVLAGAKALDAWADDAIREDVDGSETARRVYKAMTSAAGGNMSRTETSSRGWASGWAVQQVEHGWQWSAYAPGGGEVGIATTKDAAKARARAALRRLSET